jgi:alkanesulfonate monooxygenase SsuD/methylene tetrahydromethanopterin reductase-like flavin-dependent oxidoreductase (luciferase family)
MAMDLPLDMGLKLGFPAHTETPDEARRTVELAERLGYDSLSHGDHLAFAVPIGDPLIQLGAAAAFSRRLTMMTAVYLLPLRHPAAVAKQVASSTAWPRGG